MADPSIAIQTAIDAKLRGDTGVKATFPANTIRLYTLSAPNDAPYPFIVIGEDQVLGDDTECASASEVICAVHVWARQDTPANSRLKAKEIAGAVRSALTQKLSLTGHDMVDWSFGGANHITDTDGLTAHSILTFNYETAENA